MIDLSSEDYFKSISEFQFDLHLFNQGLLGVGSFGVVKLALHKGTNKIYAIKIIDCTKFKTQAQLKLAKRQIGIHSQLDHPHVSKLWSAFCEQEKIYMVMEYAENQTLMHYLSEKHTIPESQAFKYFYQCVKALEYLHRSDVLHRNIKVQNLLLDQNLNIKLSNFGWSATQIQLKRNTFCGTFEYMAPQMINNCSYDYRVDIWGLGIVLYEILHGHPPFIGKNVEEVRAKMLTPIKYNKLISVSLRVLLQKLLSINPSERPSVNQILESEWMLKMKTLVNNSLKKQFDLNPTLLNQKITKIIQPHHKKTQSSNLCRKQLSHSNSNININFMINNYSTKKVFEKTHQHPKVKTSSAYKTLTQNSKSRQETEGRKFQKVTTFGDALKYPQYAKVLSKIKSSEDFNLKDIMQSSKKANRRKSQQSVSINNPYKMQAVRTVTETSQKKKISKKKKTFDDLSTLFKKVGSRDLFCRKQKY